MNDVKSNTKAVLGPWLMLAMKLPTDAASARMRFWRRLNGLGAVPIKSGLYALPNRAECREDFEWLRREVEEAGGEALTLEATLMAGTTDDDLRAAFDAARNDDYQQLIDAATASDATAPPDRAQIERLRRNFRRIETIDFFGAAGHARADAVLAALEARKDSDVEAMANAANAGRLPTGRIWVTRADPRVDRLASAWLIRRFVDRNATFRFTTDPHYKPVERELRFDMFEAEYTHRGNRCTFEVLAAEAGLADPGIAAIGEMIHDIDIKDGKYDRPETPGVARMIDGLARRYDDDYERLERAMLLFDDLHASMAAPS